MTDSSRLPMEEFVMQGKTEQVQTTGANLFDEKKLLNFDDPNYDKSGAAGGVFYYKFKTGEQVTVSVTKLNKDGEYLCVGAEPDGSDAHWLSHKSAEVSAFKTLTPKDGNIYLGVNTTLERVENMIRKTGGIMINCGSVAIPYEPYTGGKPSPSPDFPQPIETTPQGTITVDFTDGTNHQTVDLNCPREFTKWDRLEKIDGVWNWVFKTGQAIFNGNELKTWAIHKNDAYEGGARFVIDVEKCNATEIRREVISNRFIYNQTPNSHNIGNIFASYGKIYLYPTKDITTIEAWKNWLKINNVKIMFESAIQDLIPLSPSEQDKLNALTMYAPNTDVTNTGGCNMELTYTVDTKAYVDSKILTLSKALL